MSLNCKNIKLKQGQKSTKVAELQQALMKLGYLPKTFKADGNYGVETTAAVKKFQKATKNTVDGWVGPQTCASLNKKTTTTTSVTKTTANAINCPNINLKKGSKGENVKTLQTMLKALGYYTRQIDGDFGQYTDSAVKAYQRNAGGLLVDGIFGPVTCKKLTAKYTETITKQNNAKNSTTTVKKTVVLDPNRPDTSKNVIPEKEANLSIDGIFLIASTITPNTGFRYGNYNTLDMMDGTSYTYQTHPKQLEYTIETYLHKDKFKRLKNEFDKMTKRVCKVINEDIEAGKYVVNISYAWSNLVTHRKITIKLTEWRG